MALRYILDTNVLSEPMRPVPDPGVMSRITAARDTALAKLLRLSTDKSRRSPQ